MANQNLGGTAPDGQVLVELRPTNLVYRLLNPLGFVAFKMGRRQGARRAHPAPFYAPAGIFSRSSTDLP
jgi:hypothetical protein